MKEYIENTPELSWVLNEIDTLVDGPFVVNLKNPDLPFRGSMNQRIHQLY